MTERICPICNLRPVLTKSETCGGECGYELRRRKYYEEKERRRAGISPATQTYSAYGNAGILPSPWREPSGISGQLPPVAPPVQPPAPGQRPADEVDPEYKLHLPRRTVVKEVEPEHRATLNEFPVGGIIVDGDNHYPIANHREAAAKIAFARDVGATAWVNVGDLIDCWFISRHAKEASRLFGGYGPRLQEEIDSARPYVEAMCGLVKEAHLILGNHENRQMRLINENPGLHHLRVLGWTKMLEYPSNFTVHPYGTRLRAYDAPLDFIHGDRVPMGVKSKAAWVLANLGNRSTIFGHGHHVEQATRTFYDEAGEPIIHGAYQQGHGSIVSEQTYVTEPNWQSSFTYIEFWKDDHGKSRFSVHPILFIDGRFSWNGRVYDGRKWQ